MLRKGQLFLAAGLAGLLLAPAAAVAAPFYEGKTVTIIVPFSPGGPTDVNARTFSRFWAGHIPGRPTLVVKNLPGGRSMKGFKFVYEKAKPDGYTIYWGPWNPVGKVIGDPAFASIEYDRLVLLGSGGANGVSIVRRDAAGGINKPADLLKGGFVVGGTGPFRLPDLRTRLPLDMLGIKYKYVPGYRGGSKVFQALRNGEVQMMGTTIQVYRSNYEGAVVKTGIAMPVWYFPNFDANGVPHDSPYIKDIPSFISVYKKLRGGMPSGMEWEAFKWLLTTLSSRSQIAFLPPGSPDAAATALRAGFVATAKDKAYRKFYLKSFGSPWSIGSVAEGEKVLKNYKTVDPKIVAFLKKFAAVGERKKKKKK